MLTIIENESPAATDTAERDHHNHMQKNIRSDILARFGNVLKQQDVPLLYRYEYGSGCGIFWTFAQKYPLPEARSLQVKSSQASSDGPFSTDTPDKRNDDV